MNQPAYLWLVVVLIEEGLEARNATKIADFILWLKEQHPGVFRDVAASARKMFA